MLHSDKKITDLVRNYTCTGLHWNYKPTWFSLWLCYCKPSGTLHWICNNTVSWLDSRCSTVSRYFKSWTRKSKHPSIKGKWYEFYDDYRVLISRSYQKAEVEGQALKAWQINGEPQPRNTLFQLKEWATAYAQPVETTTDYRLAMVNLLLIGD